MHRSNGEIFEALRANESALFKERADKVRALGFDGQMQGIFATVIAAAPWVATKNIKVIQCGTLDEDDYTRKSSADSVIYLKPSFTLSTDNTEFKVDILVQIQKTNPRDSNQVVHNLARQEFSFTHEIDFKKPGMTPDERREIAHKMAAMSWEQDMDYWFGDNAAMLQVNFSQDLQQINLGLRQFFGEDTKAPGG